jgi:hypothetical protein
MIKQQIESFLSATKGVVDATEKYIKQMEEINMSYMSDMDIDRQNLMDEPVNTLGTKCITLDAVNEIQALRRAKDIIVTLANESGELSEDGELSHAEVLEKERMLMHEREMIWKYLGYRFKRIEEIDKYLLSFDGHPEYNKSSAWRIPIPWLSL